MSTATGLPLHVRALVDGVGRHIIYKALTRAESADGAFPPARTLLEEADGWRTADGSVTVSGLRDPRVVAPGDVVRLQAPGQVRVLWRRAAAANFLFATERCNSLCLMCSQPPRDVDDDWRVEELLQTIALIDRGAAHLTVTGGEPTLLGEGLSRVLDAAGRHLPETQLHVLTNGRLFANPRDAERWSSAGGARTTWAVPLYADVAGLHDEIVGAPGAFEETMEGLYQLARVAARVEIRVVLHQLTAPRLPQLAAFVYRRMPFVEHVAFMGLEPMGFAKGARDRLWIDPADYADDLGKSLFHLVNRDIPASIYNLPLCALPRRLWPFARQSISEWKNTFDTTCDDCAVRAHCAGFFGSAGSDWRSRSLRRLTLEDLSHAVA